MQSATAEIAPAIAVMPLPRHDRRNKGAEERIRQLNGRYKQQREQAEFFYKLAGKLIPLVDKSIATRILRECESEVRHVRA